MLSIYVPLFPGRMLLQGLWAYCSPLYSPAVCLNVGFSSFWGKFVVVFSDALVFDINSFALKMFGWNLLWIESWSTIISLVTLSASSFCLPSVVPGRWKLVLLWCPKDSLTPYSFFPSPFPNELFSDWQICFSTWSSLLLTIAVETTIEFSRTKCFRFHFFIESLSIYTLLNASEHLTLILKLDHSKIFGHWV